MEDEAEHVALQRKWDRRFYMMPRYLSHDKVYVFWFSDDCLTNFMQVVLGNSE